MKDCKTCTNALFDQFWGEYKCKKRGGFVIVADHQDCEDYKKGRPGISKGIEDRLNTI